MANVMFKRGTQSSLNNLIASVAATSASFAEGSFYLTTDTDRLYVAQSTTELVELNKSITTVSSVTELNNIPYADVALGQFYYISPGGGDGSNIANGNILAVCTGKAGDGKPTWTQINPDTNDNHYLRTVEIQKGSTSSNGAIPYTMTFTTKDKNGNNLASGGVITASFSVSAADIINALDVVNSVSVADSVATVSTQIKNSSVTPNTNSVGSSFAIKGGANVTIEASSTAANTFVISSAAGADSFRLAATATDANKAQIALQDSMVGNSHGAVVELQGGRGLSLIQSTTGAPAGQSAVSATQVIQIGHSATAAALVANTATRMQNLDGGSIFTAISGIDYDDYGHITAATATTFQLPKIIADKIGVDATDPSKLTLGLKDQAGNATTAISGQVLYNTIYLDGSETATYVYNQGNIGSFYTKAAIDSMMRSLDALTYKGTVASATDLAGLDSVSNGDTYKASADFTLNGETVHTGDLIIATGTEVDGVIASPTWTVVASGSDTDSRYATVVEAGSTANQALFGIRETGSGSKWETKVSTDGVITLAPTAGTTNTAGQVAGELAFAHATSGATSGAYGSNSASVVAGGSVKIPAISVDSYGHVTAISDTSVTLPGNPKLTKMTGSGEVGVDLKDSAGNKLNSLEFIGGNLLTASATAISATATGILFSHDTITTTTTATQSTVSLKTSAQTITAISAITHDDYGHIIDVKTSEITIGQVAYRLDRDISTATNAVTITTKLKDVSGAVDTYQDTIKSASGTLAITVDNSRNINLEIVWGSF